MAKKKKKEVKFGTSFNFFLFPKESGFGISINKDHQEFYLLFNLIIFQLAIGRLEESL